MPDAATTSVSGADPVVGSSGERRPQVLVIDDSEPFSRLVKAWLAPAFVVSQAGSCVAGLRHAVDNPTDVILLDIEMPEVNGFECCRLLKSDPRTRDIPVIFLTGVPGVESKVRAFECGGHDYITKPFNPAEFKARVSAALRVKELIDRLTRAANIDAVTSLHNRACFDGRLAAMVSQAGRTGRVFSCLLVNLDGFRQLNDARGHAFGDRALRLAGQGLLGAMRPEDEVFRFGSDVFALLMPDVGLRGAEAAAARVVEAVSEVVGRDGMGVELRCRIGVATLDPAAGNPAEELLDRVDRAIRDAKDSPTRISSGTSRQPLPTAVAA